MSDSNECTLSKCSFALKTQYTEKARQFGFQFVMLNSAFSSERLSYCLSSKFMGL